MPKLQKISQKFSHNRNRNTSVVWTEANIKLSRGVNIVAFPGFNFMSLQYVKQDASLHFFMQSCFLSKVPLSTTCMVIDTLKVQLLI